MNLCGNHDSLPTQFVVQRCHTGAGDVEHVRLGLLQGAIRAYDTNVCVLTSPEPQYDTLALGVPCLAQVRKRGIHD